MRIMDNESIYRLRSTDDNTIDELINSYLWFSKPAGFKDNQDSNIQAYFDNCDILDGALKESYSDEDRKLLIKKLRNIGICCFTDKLLTYSSRKRFPRGMKSICVEYNKNMLEHHFLYSQYALANCFKEVSYYTNPTMFSKDGDYHIVTQEDENGFWSEPVRLLINDPKKMDKLLWMMFTRIDKRFQAQREWRIVLAGRNIPSFDDNILGYKVPIPEDAITAIHTYPNTPQEFIERIKQIEHLSPKLR